MTISSPSLAYITLSSTVPNMVSAWFVPSIGGPVSTVDDPTIVSPCTLSSCCTPVSNPLSCLELPLSSSLSSSSSSFESAQATFTAITGNRPPKSNNGGITNFVGKLNLDNVLYEHTMLLTYVRQKYT